MNDLVSEYQQYQDASVDEEEFDEEEEAEDAEWIALIAEFKMPRRRRQRERQKSNRSRLAKQQLCTRVTLFKQRFCCCRRHGIFESFLLLRNRSVF